MARFTLKSHTETQILEALAKGQEVWELDTGNDGEDDTLIGTSDEVIADLLSHYELRALPEHWTLDRVEALAGDQTYFPVRFGYLNLNAMREASTIVEQEGPDISWYVTPSLTSLGSWIAWDDSNPADPGYAEFPSEADAIAFHREAFTTEFPTAGKHHQ